MARMIPDSCPSKASAGEKRLFALLQTLLPDDFTVWYEPVVQGRYPDFIVLSSTFGLLAVEVKGWYAPEIKRASDAEVELHLTQEGQTVAKKVANPVRQARDYMLRTMDELARHPELRMSEGPRQGHLCFPCGHGVLLTNIKREQLGAGLAEVFPPEQVLCRDELTALEAGQSDRDTILRLKQFFTVAFPFEPLTESQIKLIRGTLHKEAVLAVAEGKADGGVPAGESLKILDERQEALAKNVGPGHRVFFGVAGSGKTVLLLARARLIAQGQGKRVLFTCYNRALTAYAHHQLTRTGGAPGNVEVLTFHAWAMRLTRLSWRPTSETWEAFEARLVPEVLRVLGNRPDTAKFDAVIIDEGHDFKPEWLRCCVAALKREPEGDLIIAVDGAQSLYGRKSSFTWKSVGVNVVGRSRRLSTNYRNTRQVLDFAWEVAQSHLQADEETETHVRVEPAEIMRTGSKPVYKACRNAQEEHAAITAVVRRLLARGLAPEEICVLYPRQEGARIRGLVAALKEAGPVCWLSDKSDRTGLDRFMSRPGVRLSTAHSAKGLEFPAVVFTSVDQLPNPMKGDDVADSNLLYVGLTRAMEYLVLTWAGRSKFTDRVTQSFNAVPLDDGDAAPLAAQRPSAYA